VSTVARTFEAAFVRARFPFFPSSRTASSLQHPGDARGLAESRFDHGFHGIPIPRNIRRSGNSLENRERISLPQAEPREDSMMTISGTLPPPRGYLSAMSNRDEFATG